MGMRLKSCIICLVSNQKKEVIFQSKFPTYISVFGQHAIEEKKKTLIAQITLRGHISLQLHDQCLELCRYVMLVKSIFKVSEMKGRNRVV